jgi:hypothetical protein
MTSVESRKICVHPNFTLQKYLIGRELSPVLVIDNLVAEPYELVSQAQALSFSPIGKSFPGIRAVAPIEYQQFLLSELSPYLKDHFEIPHSNLRLSLCHYSIVTTPANKLSLLQCIPHFDSVDEYGLATVHYLFKENLGGTAFYRHRKTGYETINESRRLPYLKSLESENEGPHLPQRSYINGETVLFEQIGKQEGVFNRIVIYRRNLLHSGCINESFIPDSNPSTGRLSINSFIDVKQ